MKKIFLNTIMISISFLSVANASTRYQDIVTMFNNSKNLDSRKFEGAYAGRCFDTFTGDQVKSENDATGALLVGKAVNSPANDSGPLFPSKQEHKVILANAANNDLLYFYRFDNWTEKQALDNFEDSGIESNLITDTGASQVWNSKYSSGAKENLEAREYQNYIVVVGLDLVNGEKIACYFYKKLK